jgi:TolB-like protein
LERLLEGGFVKRRGSPRKQVVITFTLIFLAGCATEDVFFDPNMDFGSLQTVAVLPFENLTGDKFAAARVRDAFANMLLATGAVYVLPPGEVARGIGAIGSRIPREGPSSEQVKELAAALEVDAVITGVLLEYGPVRSGAASANVVSISLQMAERGSGAVVWSASSTKGGVSVWDRLLGGGGKPMNAVTEKVVNDLLDKLFQ